MMPWRGINAAAFAGREGAELTRHLIESMATVDAYLSEVDAGFKRVSNGQQPSANGLPIGSGGIGALTDYLYLPGRFGGQTLKATTYTPNGAGYVEASVLTIANSTNQKLMEIGTWSATNNGHEPLDLRMYRQPYTYPTYNAYTIYSSESIEVSTPGGNDGFYMLMPGGLALDGSAIIYGWAAYPTNVTLTLKEVAAQSADIQQWQDSSGVPLLSVNKDGKLTFFNYSGVTHSTVYKQGEIDAVGSAGYKNFYIYADDLIYLNSYNNGVQIGTTLNTVALKVFGNYPTPTADIQRWINNENSNTTLLAVNKNGNFTDDLFAIADNSDITKKLAFQLSGITTATTRTLTIPDASGTIVLTSDLSTYVTTNTSQTITGAKIFDVNSGTPVVISNLAGNGGYLKIFDSGSGFSGLFDVLSAGFSADRTFSLPDGTGEIIIGAATQTLQNKTLAVNNKFNCNSANGSQFRNGSSSTQYMTWDLSAFTTSRIKTWSDIPCLMASIGNGADPPASGAMGKVNKTAQAAAIAATNLTNTTPAGYYVVNYVLEDTTADVTAGTMQFQINYTDDIGATNQTGAALAMTATGRDSKQFEVYLASGNITYQTNLVGIIGTARYALRVRVSFLG